MTFAAAVPGPDGQPLDQIRLAGVTATGHHGVLAHERTDGQVFSADVVLHLDTRAAASSDDLAQTVSYADVAHEVHDVLAGSPADLVETVAERIAAVVLAHPAVQAVDVRVHKPQAPIPVPFDDVAVVVRRDRSRPAVVPAAPAAQPAEAPAVAAAAPESSQPEPSQPEPLHPEPPQPEPAHPEPPHAPVPPAPVVAATAAEPVAPTPPADPLDATPAEPVEAVLALGANLGDAQVTLRQAVTDVDRLPGVQVMEVSPLARTAAVGGPEQPDYLNAVLVVRTTLSPRDLLRSTQQVEALHGRVREERWGPRTLDVDIVQYGTLVASAPDLELPHPRAQERAFVLVPWAEVAPDALLGGRGGGPVGQLAVTAPDRAGIRWLALDWLTGPTQSTGQVSVGSDPAPSSPVPQSAPQGHDDAAYPAEAPEGTSGGAPVVAPAGEPYSEPYSEPYAEPYADPYTEEQQPAPEVAHPHAEPSAEPRREDPPAEARAAHDHPFGGSPFGPPEPEHPRAPRPFAPFATVTPDVAPHAPVPPAPDSSGPVSSGPVPSAPVPPAPAPPITSSFAPPAAPPTPAPEAYVPEVYTPEAYAPEAYAPETFAPEPVAPEPSAPEPFAQVAYVPEQPTPDQPASHPIASRPVRHEPVPPAPEPASHAGVPPLPGPFAPRPDAHPGPSLSQELYGEDDR
ncbi:2-amino-4-hydroxy-6-hydroxymethyldihydropteridine diphosphokinase [Isoptericola sp. NPDC055881]